MRGVVLLLAAGQGTRLGCGPKGFVELGGVPLVVRAAQAAAAAVLVDGLVVAVPPARVPDARALLSGFGAEVVEGASTRQGSAVAALAAAGSPPAVAVHDAARALCPANVFDGGLAALDDFEAVIPAVPASDTLKEAADGRVTATLDRSRIVAVQTPQCFRTDTYRRALDAAVHDGFDATDDAALVERLGIAVHLIDGDERSLKITTPADLRMAAGLL